MVNTVIANYLKSYGGKYKLEDLRSQIISKGYTEAEFNEALEVFRKEGTENPKLAPGTINPLPTQKFVGGKKKSFGLLKFFLILLGILAFAFGLIVLFNFMDMAFFGFNIFDFFGGASS